MSANKVTFGLRNVHVAFMTNEVTPAWAAPKALKGAVKIAPSAVGGTETFYADDSKYFVITTNNGYDIELEVANLPDEVLAEMLGWELDDNGMLVELQDAQPKPFALMGEVQGDVKNRRFVYYNCKADRPAKERSTKGDTTTPQTDALQMSVSPIELDGRRVVKGDIELSATNATAYNDFYTAVYKPVFA
jgi:phi13 family phage major tail protein